MKKITLAIDVMGGDYGIPVVIPACVNAVRKNPNLCLMLVGHREQIEKALKQQGVADTEAFNIVHASEVVAMDELPSQALRNKKDSSMRVAINLVKEGHADACVSAGNTGALMAVARFLLRTLPCIDRPAIITEFPTRENRTRVVDLGANVDAGAEFLFQFAVMGSALIRALDKKEKPTIALLNIGVEEIKGNEQIKRAAQMLSECESLNYVGYVEGDDIFKGTVDLVVCDGFIGNVALKSSEGIAKLILHVLKESFHQSLLTRIAGLLAKPALNRLKNKMDPARYNGASLIGLNGIVIKSHGGADAVAFENALENAMAQVNNRVVDLVRDQINDFVNEGLLL